MSIVSQIMNLLVLHPGRIGRQTYLLTAAGWVAILLLNGILPFFEIKIPYAIFVLLLIVPALGLVNAQIKRWHDHDKSGSWLLLSFIPLVNLYALVTLLFIKGTPGTNKYGDSPV